MRQQSQYQNFDQYLESFTKSKSRFGFSEDFKYKILNLTVDQFKHEEFLIDTEIQKLKEYFANQEIHNKEKYANICTVHSDLLNPINGSLHRLQNNEKLLKINHQSLQDSLNTINFSQISNESQAFKEQHNNLDKIFNFISIPSILNQCLQSSQLLRAIQIIRHYEKNFKIVNQSEEHQDQQKPKILRSIDKEVSTLKQKVIKAIYMQLETSFRNSNSTFPKIKKTKDYITMLKALNESVDQIHIELLKSRAKYLRQFTQKQTLDIYKSMNYQLKSDTQEGEMLIKQVLVPFIGQIKDIYFEFTELNIKSALEWLIIRQGEVRSLIKVILSKAKVRDVIEIIKIVDQANKEMNQWVVLVIGDLVRDQMEGRMLKQIDNAMKRSLSAFLKAQNQVTDKNQFKSEKIINLIKINLLTLQGQINQISCLQFKERKAIFSKILDRIFNKTVPSVLLQYYEMHFLEQNVVIDSMADIIVSLKDLSYEIQSPTGNHSSLLKLLDYFEIQGSLTSEPHAEEQQQQQI